MGGKKTPPERGSGESREAYTGLRLLINPKPIKPMPRRARETGSGAAATPASPFTAKRARSIPPSSHSDPFQEKVRRQSYFYIYRRHESRTSRPKLARAENYRVIPRRKHDGQRERVFTAG